MEPDIAGPTVLDQVLVLVLVPPHVAGDVLRGQRDVGVGVAALSAADLVVKYHDADGRKIARNTKQIKGKKIGATAAVLVLSFLLVQAER